MSDYVAIFDAGQKLPNGQPADDLFVIVDAVDELDARRQLWDLLASQHGEVYDKDQAEDVMAGRHEVLAEQWMVVVPCPSCQVRVIRTIKIANLATTFVDAEPTETGNILLTRFSRHGPPMARTLNTAAQFGRTNLRTLHNCRRRQSKGVHA